MTNRAAALLAPDEPPACTVLRPNGRSAFVLSCDHGGNAFPRALGSLGVSDSERERHIAWDRGVAGVGRALSELLDAPLVLANYSRLVIDCNRPLDSPDSVPRRSEDTEVPGNRDLSPEAIEGRRRALFYPYHEALREVLDRRDAEGRETVFVALHSFTPSYLGKARPWDVSLLYRDRRLSAELIELLEDVPGLCVGDNQPYQIGDDHDYGIPVHGEQRGLVHALLEIRQDHLESEAGQRVWAERIADVLPRAHDRLKSSS